MSTKARKENLQLLLDALKHFEKGEISEEQLKPFIFHYVSDDETILINMVEILSIERERKSAMISDMNLELSRSLVGYDYFNSNKEVDKKQRVFIIGEIKKFYLKWKDYIRCCFQFKDLP